MMNNMDNNPSINNMGYNNMQQNPYAANYIAARNKKKRNSAIIIALFLVAALVVGFTLISGFFKTETSHTTTVTTGNSYDESVAVLHIYGAIQSVETYDSVSYNHSFLMNTVDDLMLDETNKGIFLKVNSGGGTVYHSDELYLKLMEYKEETGRPIYAYFESTAASGAYYIACAADEIYANRNTTTGSIGVIISYLNLSGLYENLGIEEVMIVSGANKGMGAGELNEEQKAIYQSVVDESYEQFVSIVSEGRNMSIEEVKVVADGRIYTGPQGVENGLIDELMSLEDAEILVMEKVQADLKYIYYNHPEKLSWTDLLFASQDETNKSELEIIGEIIDDKMAGIPLYLYQN